MTREELIQLAKRIYEINQIFKETELDTQSAKTLEEEESELFYQLQQALPHSWIFDRIACNMGAPIEELIDLELEYERTFIEKGYTPMVLRTRNEVVRYLRDVLCIAPAFIDPNRPYRTVHTEFDPLRLGILRLRDQLGEDKCQRLVAMLDSAQAHFELDPKAVTKHYRAGRQLLIDVDDILMGSKE